MGYLLFSLQSALLLNYQRVFSSCQTAACLKVELASYPIRFRQLQDVKGVLTFFGDD